MATAAGGGAQESRDSGLRQLGKYEISGELGRGSFGRVYRGFDPFVQREVAIKVADTLDGELPEQLQKAFFAEARAAGRLHHPGIVTLFDAGTEGSLNYLVMEFVAGETLKRPCQRDAPRPKIERVADLMLKCALALDYVHRAGVLHKDIKPGNIMVTPAGQPKIMDFGIAALAGADRSGGISGSPLFMSPEQIEGRELTPAADLYSLGMVMYLLLTGEPPFIARDTRTLFARIQREPAPPVQSKREDLPDAVCEVVNRLLAKDPAARYPSGRKLAEDLAPLAQEGGPRRRALKMSHDSLRRLEFFKAFRSPELAELMDASTSVTYRAGDTIIREGETDNALYILLMGIAEVRKNGQMIALLEKGDCFGEIGFLYAVQRTASVVASTDVLVLQVNAALLDKMSDECQLRYYRIFCENLILRLTATTEKAATLLPKSDLALDFILP
ncbi:serine/threonine protein kinase [Solimonas sp. K1W22B-7]|uniref:serine/threonine-protein kinase n=1 Tax=Solimonas sp. K1W22B-7 TaxID=2303331 RepID=UPI000E335288|nr:serine/threonine-protein kinase [Solimonas sp. K1W22B-7]AXQ28332.1 serine/threonine protein kinase [Solimonas sp. K1W22B-7]